MRLLVTIVLYNKSIEESLSYKTFCKINPNADLLIMDNSTIETNNYEVCKKNSILYVNNNGNIGLPKSYNKIVKYYPDYDFYTILDDDTNLVEDYFSELFSQNFTNVDIIFPKIITNTGYIASPTYSKDYPTKPFPINSATCYSKKILEKFKFNENLFMYFVDYDFFLNIYKNEIEITYFQLNTPIVHNLSDLDDFSSSTLQSMYYRMQDAKIYFSTAHYLKYKIMYCLARFRRFKKINILLFFFKYIKIRTIKGG